MRKFELVLIFIISLIKELEEPGDEVNRFDQLAPTVVKPKKWQFVNVSSNNVI